MRKFLFLYLNTGNGHYSIARMVKETLESRVPDVQTVLLNGFGKRQIFSRAFFEKGYRVSCSVVPGAFSLVYELGKTCAFQNFLMNLVTPSTSAYLEKVIREEQITDIVSFHFTLTPSAVRAARRVNPLIPVTVVVTDPFTFPNAWFYEKSVRYLVFSDQVKTAAVHKLGIRPENVNVIPFLINTKFISMPDSTQLLALKQKYGINPGKKTVLLAGGGEGLPGAIKIVTELLLRKSPHNILVVCGRDKAAKTALEVLVRTHPHSAVKLFGFVNFMDELVKISDCAIIKAGTATLFEVIKCKKPVIICRYIHGQELGNVRFAVRNGLGWFIRDPKEICQKVQQLFTDDSYYAMLKARINDVRIDTDTQLVCDLLCRKQGEL